MLSLITSMQHSWSGRPSGRTLQYTPTGSFGPGGDGFFSAGLRGILALTPFMVRRRRPPQDPNSALPRPAAARPFRSNPTNQRARPRGVTAQRYVGERHRPSPPRGVGRKRCYGNGRAHRLRPERPLSGWGCGGAVRPRVSRGAPRKGAGEEICSRQ